MRLFHYRQEGERLPRGYAPAWNRWEDRKIVCAPIGLHLLVRWLRQFYWWLFKVGFPDYIYRERQRWVTWEREFWLKRLHDTDRDLLLAKRDVVEAENRGYAQGWNAHVNHIQKELDKWREERRGRQASD